MASETWPFDPDHDGINEIARSPGVRDALIDLALRAKADAEERSADFTDTGDYVTHFEADSDTIDWVGEYPGRRGAAILKNTSDHALAVEFGNKRNDKPHHVLGNVLKDLHV